jgi:wyosine [tRNA(Phe)-imidazoG37] synthetase (radical SAM superfamily)
MKHNFKYIYGPVSSWRLGKSLGIDPISAKSKICNFDCIYCQLGLTKKFQNQRKEFVPISKIINELKAFSDERIDYYTFSARGEPTLAENLGGMIKAVKKLKKGKIAVITNGSLIDNIDVRRDLMGADFVLIKLDAYNQESLQCVNQPMRENTINNIIKGIKRFKKEYKGKLAIQVMFIKENIKYAKEISEIIRSISPDEVQINTPRRPSGVLPLTKNEIKEIKPYFKGLNVKSVYDFQAKEVKEIDYKMAANRHGDYRRVLTRIFHRKIRP